jgi:hypothetical protein
MRTVYRMANGAMPTTTAQPKVATGATIKTMLQLATPSTRQFRVIEWGISFDASAAAVPVNCELVETGAIAATVTAHVAAGVQPYNDPNASASLATLGTAATGYTASAEGTITATRYADLQLIAPTNQYVYQWPLAQEFVMGVSRFLRIRVTAPATVNALCYMMWSES